MKQHIEIVRLYGVPIGSAKQTEGELYLVEDNKIIFECKTLELPWKENKSRVSCIPAKTYKGVKRHTKLSAFKYEHLHILDVENREWILIHGGNYNTDIVGCILVGDSYSDLNKDGLNDVLNSRKTLAKLLSLIKENEIEIRIVWR